MSFKEIPISKKPHIGLVISEGLNKTLERARNGLQMSRSEFVRYCIMKTLQDLSILSEQIKGVDVYEN